MRVGDGEDAMIVAMEMVVVMEMMVVMEMVVVMEMRLGDVDEVG